MELNVVDKKVVELVLITPEQAKRLLSNNSPKNRTIRKSWVGTLAYALKNGNWIVPGNIDAIVIDDNGEVINGQHRLSAIVSAGIPAPVYMVYGVDTDAYKFMDNGAKRTLADAVSSLENSRKVAAVGRTSNAIENGRAPIGSALKNQIGGHERFETNIKMDVEYVERNIEALEKCVRAASRMRDATGGGSLATYGSFLKTIMWIEGDDQVLQFCDDFCSILPQSKSVSVLKTVIMKRNSGKSSIERAWLFGILAQGYEAYKKEIVTGIPTTAMNKSSQYLSKINRAIEKRREKNDGRS